MIQNAKDVPLNRNPGSLPDLSGALLSWFQPMDFTLITKAVVNAQLTEIEVPYSYMGVRQPFTVQQLLIKPEGQRSWKWETIHAYPELNLKTDDIIVFNAVTYRVMQKLDWSEYAFVEYHICEAYV